MTQKQIIVIAKSLGRLAGQDSIDEYTRRRCVTEIESVISSMTNGFEQNRGGQSTGRYITGNISLREWRTLARVDQPITKKETALCERPVPKT